MSEIFTKTFEIRWADLDPNRHLAYTSYDQYAAHVRSCYLAENGFTAAKFGELGFGPVLFRQEITFLKEVLEGEKIKINFLLGEMLPDGSRWKVVNEVYRQDGQKSAVINTEGAWLNLRTRKLIAPPKELRAALENLPHVVIINENTTV